MPASWRDFWNRDTPIYVNDRHRSRHYAGLAEDLVGLVPGPRATLLDYGSGEALSADRVARACARLYLCDAAPRVRSGLSRRFGAEPRIVVLAPEDLPALPDRGLDLIVAHSVAQYLTAEEFAGLLRLWHAKLRPGGLLIVADVIPPDLGPLADALALLGFGWREGFLAAALAGLLRTALSDYPSLRRRLGLTRYARDEMLARLREAGFDAEPRANLGHNRRRLAFAARRPAARAPA
ncbi:Methyltransferase type 12 [Methylobacterium sp. 4-46]|uniref:class I SAM-dependent methyltransferase n=1 Tax=unclassified Methylobacterium TaxID=2615210 RepID=UPI000165C6FB|nr:MULTISPECIES: methyltransferase domain-containing protein [Methylobacterium]ACA17446.1 Methyltransferase type 12 [Methylobacterium sp. 4-46]WFT83131.1 methyltransferase domain-containing protein [Methylobacterium nodulans]